MTSITLFYAPVTCARVPLVLLEEIGAPFEVRLLRLMIGEHKAAPFKLYNPKGKLPAILVDGEPLTENVAIIGYLNARFPYAGLLPRASTPIVAARQTADLCFCAATLHPFVSRVCVPMSVAPPDAQAAVQKKACEGIQEYLKIVEERLEAGPWWYGETWSAMDAYLYWVSWRIGTVGFDMTAFPCLADHTRRVELRPATQRAISRDAEVMATLEAEGLAMKP
jgi:glutathione S-transferase